MMSVISAMVSAALYELCDDEPKLAAFKAELLKRYGPAPKTADDNEDDDGSD